MCIRDRAGPACTPRPSRRGPPARCLRLPWEAAQAWTRSSADHTARPPATRFPRREPAARLPGDDQEVAVQLVEDDRAVLAADHDVLDPGPVAPGEVDPRLDRERHPDPELLRVGMAFSVEPGIYLAGRYGARIEDIVICGEDGPIVLNQLDRDLLVVTG